jgi:hypothetical protein
MRYRLNVSGFQWVEASADWTQLSIVLMRNSSRLTVTLWSDGWIEATWGVSGPRGREREAIALVRALRRALLEGSR